MEEGFCQCGCGRKTREVNGNFFRYIHGHNRRGQHRTYSAETLQRMSEGQKRRFSIPSNHPRWNGGIMIHEGYLFIKKPEHYRANNHGYVKNCILIAEEWLHFPITNNVDVHHINGNKLDDRPINLAILSHGGHAKVHGKIRGGLNFKGGNICKALSKSSPV
jgi:hypothetical protein